MLTHLGRHDGALEYYRQALMLNPVSPALGGKVALLEIETGNVERGTYLLESLVHRCVLCGFSSGLWIALGGHQATRGVTWHPKHTITTP